jgi:hypothetical protein
MSGTCPTCAKTIPIGDIRREFACPFCGTRLKSNLFPVLFVVLFIGGLPALGFLHSALPFLAVTVAGTLLCAFVGLYFLSLQTA